MPILKEAQSRPVTKDAIVLDLGDLSRQGVRLREAAEAKARQVLADARAEAQRLVADAEQVGFVEGHAKGLEAGRAEGLEAGRAEALAAGQQAVQQATGAFLSVAQQWEQARQELDRDAHAAVLRLAMKLARKVTHRVIEAHPEVVTDQVADALAKVLEPTDVTIALHPDDVPVVEEVLPDLLAGLGHLQKVALASDEQLQRGGCVLRLGGGQVDASLETQLRRIAELLVPGGTVEASAEAVDQPDVSSG